MNRRPSAFLCMTVASSLAALTACGPDNPAHPGTATDAGPIVVSPAPDSGTSGTDSAVAADSTAAPDTGSGSDSAPSADTGSAADSGSVGDTGSAGDTGSTADSGTMGMVDATADTEMPATDGASDAGMPVLLPGPSRGSSLAISPDDSVAVVCNRDVGTVTILSLSAATPGALPTVGKVAELPVGVTPNGGAEPWQVAISPDSTTAYVVLRREQKVVKLLGINGPNPTVGAAVVVGSEPTSVALTPTGATAYVANWVDGTVTVISTASMSVTTSIDLNAALLATGYLGDLAVAGATPITTRPALAHPRSLAVTNSGTGVDADEFVYVTEYYAQATAPESAPGNGTPGNADTRKVGVVYRIKSWTGA